MTEQRKDDVKQSESVLGHKDDLRNLRPHLPSLPQNSCPESETCTNSVIEFGNIAWNDTDRVGRLITQEIPEWVNADIAYHNAKKHCDEDSARIEHDRALQRVLVDLMKDDTQLFQQISDNESFRRWLADSVFSTTYQMSA